MNRLVPDLARLERLVSDEGAAVKRNAMRSLRNFADDNDLAQLEDLLAEAKPEIPRLDFLGTLGISQMEAAHSNFLRWLLHPSGDHRADAYFLKNFLREVSARAEDFGIAVASACEINAIDWSASDARREERRIDILIVDPTAKFLCAIENKIQAPEGNRQLSSYRRVLEDAYPDYTRQFVFLTPTGRQSQEETERAHWVPVGYAAILELVERTIANPGDPISEEARAALQFYATALRRRIVPESTETQQLARKIYLEHHEAIELIYKNKPNIVIETEQIFQEAIARSPLWKEEGRSPNHIRFSSNGWDEFDSFKTGTAGAWRVGEPSPALLFEIDYTLGHPYLVLMLGPGNGPIRRKIYATTRQHLVLFNRAYRELRSYRSLYRAGPITEVGDFSDPQRLRDKIMGWLDDFAENDFPRIDRIIGQAFSEYEAGK